MYWGTPISFVTQWNYTDTTMFVSNLEYMFYAYNASVNLFLVHGGTNFGFINGAHAEGSVSFRRFL